jgi:2-keto-4-pentenoate hydratase/2-oxohepta-3-ene-1,7-dioic acid hydratase in catechol pathway
MNRKTKIEDRLTRAVHGEFDCLIMLAMKLATFEVRTGLGRFQRLGLVLMTPDEPLVIDLNAAYAWMLRDGGASDAQARRQAECFVPPDMRLFLEMGEMAMSAAKQVQKFVESLPLQQPESLIGLNEARLVFRMGEIQIKTPVPNPPMLRDFLSFETHTANGFKRRNEPIPEPWYRIPVYYKGNPHSLIGPEDPVFWPRYSKIRDYELELACIIGKEGRNIPVDAAGQYIAGYAIMNDFSARDTQRDEMICRLGPAKGKDFSTAVGPWLVTADEVPDVRNLRMTAKVNGELWSDGNSGTSHWTFEQMIAHVSQEETIYPGEVLGSGTVGFGCGLELDRWLQPGDVVELEIEGLGILRNRILEH